jgi:hypothetical protein
LKENKALGENINLAKHIKNALFDEHFLSDIFKKIDKNNSG